MSEGLLDQLPDPPSEPKFDFVLFDEERFRFLTKGGAIWKVSMTEADAAGWTERLAKSFCRHLSWQKSGSVTIAPDQEKENAAPDVIKTRSYVIRRD